MTLAEQIHKETKRLPEPWAQEVLNFIGYLKHQAAPAGDDADADWAEFEKLAGSWRGRFDREECKDRFGGTV